MLLHGLLALGHVGVVLKARDQYGNHMACSNPLAAGVMTSVCCCYCCLQAMVVRGFLGPEQHNLYLMRSNETSLLANVLAVGLLGGLIFLVSYLK